MMKTQKIREPWYVIRNEILMEGGIILALPG